MRDKITTAAEAVAVIQSGDAVCTSGFVGIGVPDELLLALEKRFVETGEPRGLTLLFAAGQGDGKDRGLNALGHDGLLKRAVGGHWGTDPEGRPPGAGGQDRGVQPAARRDLPPVSRHRRRQARHPLARRRRHLRRPAARRRQDQRHHHRFRLTAAGLELVEVAPGVDIERDIAAQMRFRPIIGAVRLMDPRIFRLEPMDLKGAMLNLDLSDRLAYDADRNTLFLNFEGVHVR